MAASSNSDKKQGWMAVREFNAKSVEYFEEDAETGERVIDVRSEQLRKLFTDDEWTKLCAHHNIKTHNRERLMYHWLGLKPSGSDEATDLVVKERKELLLSLWANEIFHPFVDVDGACKIINGKNCNTWVLRLSTTEPGNLTISYPNVKSNGQASSRTLEGEKEINHIRIYRTDGKFSLWGNQYNSIGEVIATMTAMVTASIGTTDGGQDVEPEPYYDS